jgi:RimJ/RimL family protein N-acetyltransferase
MSHDDLDFVSGMLGDPETMRFYPKPLTREESAGWIDRRLAQYENHGHSLWLVELTETGEPVGQVGLVPQLIDGVLEPEIGYLVARAHWRKGIASEAAAGVRDFAFSSLNRSHVISLVRPVNAPSQAVARSIGMSVVRSTTFANLEHLVFLVRRPPVTAIDEKS